MLPCCVQLSTLWHSALCGPNRPCLLRRDRRIASYKQAKERKIAQIRRPSSFEAVTKCVLQRIKWQISVSALSKHECNVMFLHTEIMAHSRVPTYSKNGSPEHLSALINLCLLIERHKKLILARAEPGRSAELKIPQ